MNIIFIRHAEAFCNTYPDDFILTRYDRESGLTDKGKSQAKLLVERFPEHLSPSKIFSSPLKRAAETAEFFVSKYHHPIHYDERLEEIKTPDLFKKSMTQADWDKLLFKRIVHPGKEIVKGVESVKSHYTRTVNFIKETANNSGNGNILIFTHAFTIEMAIFYLLNINIGNLLKTRFKVSNTGIFIFKQKFGRAFYLVTANNRVHLNTI